MARMVELLAHVKRSLLASTGAVTAADFEAAWEAAWLHMIDERAWQHETGRRRSWRTAMRFAKPAARDAFLDVSGEPDPLWGAIGAALDGLNTA